MAKKIFKSGNYIYLIDTDNGDRLYSGLSKDVSIKHTGETVDTFYVVGLDGWSRNKSIAFADIQDQNGAAYASLSEFISFYESQTGGASSSTESSAASLSYGLYNSILEIKSLYGDDVSISQKAKSLIKFGKNEDIQAGVAEMVWANGGIETLATGNNIDSIRSDNAGDTQTVVIEGHTISGSDLTFVVQTAVLDGTNRVVLTTPLYRATRLYNDSNVDFAGNIEIYEDGGDRHLFAPIGSNQSLKCATSLSSVDYWLVTQAVFEVKRNANAAVDFEIQVRLSGKVFRTIFFSSTNNTGKVVPFEQPLIIPPNSDVRVLATSNTNSTSVGASLQGYLAIKT